MFQLLLNVILYHLAILPSRNHVANSRGEQRGLVKDSEFWRNKGWSGEGTENLPTCNLYQTKQIDIHTVITVN
jgi:hypothetical protein